MNKYDRLKKLCKKIKDNGFHENGMNHESDEIYSVSYDFLNNEIVIVFYDGKTTSLKVCEYEMVWYDNEQ